MTTTETEKMPVDLHDRPRIGAVYDLVHLTAERVNLTVGGANLRSESRVVEVHLRNARGAATVAEGLRVLGQLGGTGYLFRSVHPPTPGKSGYTWLQQACPVLEAKVGLFCRYEADALDVVAPS